MAKVLVTGASGFIGFHLVEALRARGDEVTALVRRTSNVDRIQPLGVTVAYGDVTDPESVRGALAGQSTVFHLAGLITALRTERLYRVNEQGTRNVARACAEQTSPPVLVAVSSMAAAGPSPRDRLRAETDPPKPVSNYGRSKRAGERAAEQLADRIPITIVRPPIVFGEADTRAFQLFQTVVRSRIHFIPGYTPRKFSLIHAADLAELLILAAERGERVKRPEEAAQPARTDDGAKPARAHQQEEPFDARGYYFADSNEHPTYYHVGRLVGRALGRRWTMLIPWSVPAVWLVAGVGELIGQIRRQPVLFGVDKAREALAGAWACSGEKAAEQLGFAVRVSLEDRLRQTAQWYRKERWL